MTLSCEEEWQGVLHHLQGLVPHLQHAHHGVVLGHVGLGGLQHHLVVEPYILKLELYSTQIIIEY